MRKNRALRFSVKAHVTNKYHVRTLLIRCAALTAIVGRMNVMLNKLERK